MENHKMLKLFESVQKLCEKRETRNVLLSGDHDSKECEKC